MTGPTADTRTVEAKRAFRAFVRTHHPDRGGDPAVFIAGMARWRGTPGRPAAGHDVVFFRRRRGVAGLIIGWQRRRKRRGRPPRVR